MRYALITLIGLVLCFVSASVAGGDGILCPTEFSEADNLRELGLFGVPYLNLPGEDLSRLPQKYREMIERMNALEPHRDPVALCFAEGTDDAIVTAVSQALFGSFNNPALYRLDNRWSSTANGGTGSQGDPITLTYSFVPDGVSIPSGVGEPTAANTLFATFNAIFGDTGVWKPKFRQVFQRWTELTGIAYVESPDDGAAMFGSAGQLGVRGDVRICAKPIDAQWNILAYNYYPNGGDMVLDNAESWGQSGNNYRWMRNVCMHEHGHGIGLRHVCPANDSKLMEPYLSTSFDGPQHDDIRGGQRYYGDTYENNDANTTAYDMGTLGNGTTSLTNLSSDDNGDVDWYKFTVTSNKQVTITMDVIGFTYLEAAQDEACNTGTSITTIDDQDLHLELYSTNGTVLIASAPVQPAGTDEVISSFNLPGSGTYHIKIVAASSNNVIQLYNLSTLIANAANSITISAPNGGETWYIGQAQNITWSSSGVSGNVRIELNRSYPGGAWESLFSNTANDGTQSWTVAGTTGASCRMRIISINTPTIGDTSDANFAISNPTITVTAPNNGETWFIGLGTNIAWSSAGLTGNVNIEINRTYPGGSWVSLFSNTANDGSEAWTPTSPTTTTARIRVTSVSIPSVSDVSDLNFVISDPIITVLAPNGGETIYLANIATIQWSSIALTGNVKIELNRNYPVGGWEVLFASITNDGTEDWTVSGATSTVSRIRVSSVSQPTILDVSNNNFAISNPVITVTRPNGGEVLDGTQPENITWTSLGVAGTVSIEINRDYPAGSWNVFTTTANTGTYSAILGGPPTTTARVRVASLDMPVATDISDANCTITTPNTPPIILHDPQGDSEPGNVVFTARITDDFSVPTASLFWRAVGGGAFASMAMSSTGNPNEYAATLNLFEDSFEYYLSASDALAATSTTDTAQFDVADCAMTLLSYDDGTAEGFNWVPSDLFEWAIKVHPSGFPYQLCEVLVAIASFNPDSSHSPIRVRVLNADGPGGLPGTEIWSEVSGSIGNEIGGPIPGTLYWANVLVKEPNGNTLSLSGDFYVAVSNPDPGKFEAFGRDDNTNLGNSFFYDGCEMAWFNENEILPNAFGGQRMIRLIGTAISAPNALVIRASGNNIVLNWSSSGAAFYRIYSATNPSGPFTTLEGSTATTTFTDVGAVSASDKLFYVVVSSTEP